VCKKQNKEIFDFFLNDTFSFWYISNNQVLNSKLKDDFGKSKATFPDSILTGPKFLNGFCNNFNTI